MLFNTLADLLTIVFKNTAIYLYETNKKGVKNITI